MSERAALLGKINHFSSRSTRARCVPEGVITRLVPTLGRQRFLYPRPCLSPFCPQIVSSASTDLQDYTYYFVPAPWLSVKLLRLLQCYPPPGTPKPTWTGIWWGRWGLGLGGLGQDFSEAGLVPPGPVLRQSSGRWGGSGVQPKNQSNSWGLLIPYCGPCKATLCPSPVMQGLLSPPVYR